MMRLIRSEIRRFIKDPVFWICTVFTLAAGLYAGTKENLDVTYHIVPAAAAAVFISLVIGREHSDGGFKNKIIAGNSKGKVYLTETLLAFVYSLILSLLYSLGTGLTGRESFSDTPVSVMLLSAAAVTVCTVCFSLIFTVFSTAIASKAAAAVVNLLLIVALSVPAYSAAISLKVPETYKTFNMVTVDGESKVVEIEEPNPNYVGGVKRAVYTVVAEISPFGQGIDQLRTLKYYKEAHYYQNNYNSSEALEEIRKETDFCPEAAVAAALAASVIGYIIFVKKDIR